MGNLLIGLGHFIFYAAHISSYILFGRIIMSWVNADRRNPIVLLLYRLTDPFLWRISARFPRLTNVGGFDFSPLVLFIALLSVQFLAQILLIEPAARYFK